MTSKMLVMSCHH